jgi:hypothetical protein
VTAVTKINNGGFVMRFVNRLLGRGDGLIRKLVIGLSTHYHRYTGKSDFSRWRKTRNLSPLWDDRTRRLAAMVPPGAKVLEFGAGRRVLEQMLDRPLRYTPSDLVDRGPGTIVCDLNARPLPPFGTHDVAVFSGVLEYVNDVPSLIQHLRGSVQSIVASYAVLEKNRDGRRAGGWVNDYTAAQFVALFDEHGFDCAENSSWQSQELYRFVGRPARADS